MSTFLILVLALFEINMTTPPAVENPETKKEMTTYFFIRHAEKDTSDTKNQNPQLAAQGQLRAEKWVQVFQEVALDAIYSTDYHRTRQTAAPTAAAKNLEVQLYNPEKLFDPVFQETTKGKTVLVVGHTNTNPAFVNAILGTNKYQDLPEQESGSLFIVTLSPSGEATSQLLYFN